jgi:hypothetical protein
LNSDVIYYIVSIFIFITIVILTFPRNAVKSKEEKKAEILSGYTKQLKEALKPLNKNPEARIVKKNELLNKFSAELSLNIFFDKDELKEIILELSKVD